MAEVETKKILIKGARLSFPSLFTQKVNQDGSKGSYSAAFIIPPDHEGVAIISAEIKRVALEKWPKDHEKMLKAMKAGGKIALRQGDSKAQYAGYEGNLFFNASNKRPPGVFNKSAVQITEGCEETPYGGCYVNVTFEVWAQDNSYGQRINFSLRGVQFAADGESFGGGAMATDDEFGAPTDGAGAELPTEEDPLV